MSGTPVEPVDEDAAVQEVPSSPDRNSLQDGLRQFQLNVREWSMSLRDTMQNNPLVDNFKSFQGDLVANVKGFGENLKNKIANNRNPAFSQKGRTKQWSKNYNYGAVLEIHSVQKLLDVIEQRYSYVSITLLLISTTFETIAVASFLKAQWETKLDNWLHFEWGTANFVVLSVLSVFFTLTWIALLASTNKKFSYLFKPTSIMTYLTSFWMLFLAAAAVVTQNRAWTTVYVPFFFRSWWLHECLLALLDYPQISAFFSDNKLKMIRSMIQCLAVLAISVGMLQAIEMFCGDHMGYFNTFYMMMIVFSTIGYGDVTVKTVPGRLFLVVLIGVGISYFVPMLEYVAKLGMEHLRYARYGVWFKRTKHLILCGQFETNELRLQLENLFAEERKYFNMHVVVMLQDDPSAGILLFLNAPKYRSSVTLLVGDAGSTDDLDRCDARGSSGVFLFGNGSNSSYYSDYDVARQAMAVHEHVPDVPLFVLLHRSRYTRSVMPKNARVLEFERLNHNLLGLGCVLPGMIPFVANLVRKFDPMSTVSLWKESDFDDPRTGTVAVAKALMQIGSRQRDMYSYDALMSGVALTSGGGTAADVAIVREEMVETDPNWCDLYEASLAQHLAILALPTEQQPRSFRSLATCMYKHGVTVIGVVRRSGAKTRRTPGSAATPSPSTRHFLSPSSPNESSPRFGDSSSPRNGARTPGSPLAKFADGASPSSVHGAQGIPAEDAGVQLAPRGNLAEVEKIIVICDKTSSAQAALDALPPVQEDGEMQDFDDDTLRALRAHVEKHTGPTTKRKRSALQFLRSQSQVALGAAGDSFLLEEQLKQRGATEVVVVADSFAPGSPTSNSEELARHQHRQTSDYQSCVSGMSPVAPEAPGSPSRQEPPGHLVSHGSVEAPVVGGLKPALAVPGSPLSPRPPKTVTLVHPPSPTGTGEQSQMQQDPHSPQRRPGASPTSAMPRSTSNASLASDSSKDESEQGGRRDSITKRAPSSHALGEEHVKAIKRIRDAWHMKKHFVYIDLSAAHERQNWSSEATTESTLAKAADYFDAMRPARQHSPINQVVLLANEPNYDYLRMMWEDEMSGSLAIIQGCGLLQADLEKCNLSAAAAVVIFCAGDRCDEHGDSLAILVSQAVKRIARDGMDPSEPDIPVVVELDTTKFVSLVSDGNEMDSGEEHNGDWFMDPSFLSGRVVCRHMFDTSLQEAFFLPETHIVMDQLLSGWGDALSATSISIQEGWKKYSDVIDYCISRRLLPLAVHRLHEDVSTVRGNSFRFIVTNPPPPFPVVAADIVYCLKIR